MPRVVEGNLLATGLELGIIVTRFNSFITERLLEGALDAIRRNGGDLEAVTIYRAPGAFEVPGLLRRVCEHGGHDAVICLAAVIRGATPHFDYVAAEVTKGIAQVQLSASIPVGYGVITSDTIEQAIERAGTKAGNKGFDAAVATIEMANLYKQVGSPGAPPAR